MTINQTSQPVLHSTELYVSAAEALAAVLPTTRTLTARIHTGARDWSLLGGSGETVTATFGGQLSADGAVHLGGSLLAGTEGMDASLISVADVLRPALEAATGVLGTGVLSPATAATAEALLDDTETVVFALESAGQTAGWFGLRIRDHAGRDVTVNGSQDPGHDVGSRLGRINNVEMALTVEIGRTRMAVRDVLNLEQGTVVELDRSAGAPADVLLNGRLIAHGEVVVTDQDYGIRITRILDVAEGLG
ncbi:flagellar motor switch protein FliN [Arthrobacter sp.]|uniref:flagellar motor switch protein FliN n=1 Tax=Arthrobacter sp. TaxID=1667 RepID=UPI003A90BA87